MSTTFSFIHHLITITNSFDINAHIQPKQNPFNTTIILDSSVQGAISERGIHFVLSIDDIPLADLLFYFLILLAGVHIHNIDQRNIRRSDSNDLLFSGVCSVLGDLPSHEVQLHRSV